MCKKIEKNVHEKTEALKALVNKKVFLPIKQCYTHVCVPKDESAQRELNPFQKCFLKLSQGSQDSQSGDDVEVEEEEKDNHWCGWGYCTTLSCRHNVVDMTNCHIDSEDDDNEREE